MLTVSFRISLVILSRFQVYSVSLTPAKPWPTATIVTTVADTCCTLVVPNANEGVILEDWETENQTVYTGHGIIVKEKNKTKNVYSNVLCISFFFLYQKEV